MDSSKLAMDRVFITLGPALFLELATAEFIETHVMPDFRPLWFQTRLRAIEARRLDRQEKGTRS